MTDYGALCAQLKSLTGGVENRITNLANAAALLYFTMPQTNWAGFYIANGRTLELGPFVGKPACVAIPFGKGVCGTVAVTGKTELVPYVHNFPGHIVCDLDSNSEIVVPVYNGETLFGVMDIDSPQPGRFNEDDREGLEAYVKTLEAALFGNP